MTPPGSRRSGDARKLDLTDDQRKQLRTLKVVYDNPAITGFWNAGDCEALVSMGLAVSYDVQGIRIFTITPEGVEVANAL